MMAPKPFFPVLLKLGLAGGGLYFGLQLLSNHDPFIYWFGFLLSSVCGVWVMTGCFSLTSSSLHSAQQSQFDRYSKIPSAAHGTGRLARQTDAFVNAMHQQKGFFLGMFKGRSLFFDPFARGNGHMVTYAPARAGKTSCLIIPANLSWFDGALVMPDIKREPSVIAHSVRAKRGRRILEWNPFKVGGKAGIAINPLAILLKDINTNEGNNLHDYALLIGLVLISKVDAKESPFFRNGGRRFLVGLLLYLAVFHKGQCHLPGLRQLVWASLEEKQCIAKEMQNSSSFGGILKEYGHHLEELLAPDYIRTFGSMRDYAIEATQIYVAESDFGRSLMGWEYTIEDIIDDNTDFIQVVPEDKLEAYGSVIGLLFTLMLEVIAARDKPSKTMLLMEEMGNIGKIPNLEKALTLLPAKGVRCWFIFQSRQQAIEIYGEKVADLIDEQCSMRQSFAIRDLKEQEIWSKRSGKTTVKVQTFNHDPLDVHTPWKPSVSEVQRTVLNEDEIGCLNLHQQLISISGQPLMKADLVPYYQVYPWRDIADINPHHPEGYPSLVEAPILIDLDCEETVWKS